MQAAPGLDRLVEDELGVLVATERQRHDEDPRAAHAATLGIEELAGVAEVHLRFLTRRDFEAQRGAESRRRARGQGACHRGVAAGKAVLLDEELPARLPFHPTLVQGEHALAPRLRERLSMCRALARRRRQQLRERGRGGQRAAVEHAVTSRPHAIPVDGVATDAEVPGDPTIRLAQLQPPENLTDVGHRTPPSRHSSPPGAGVLQRGFRVTARTRKESGRAPPGGSIWPTLGGSGWVTLPGSRWATPGGSASPTPVAQYGVTADSRERDVRDESASACVGGAGRQCIEAVLALATDEVRVDVRAPPRSAVFRYGQHVCAVERVFTRHNPPVSKSGETV